MEQADDGTRLILLAIGPDLPAGESVELAVRRLADGTIWCGMDGRHGGTVGRVLVGEAVERELWARCQPTGLPLGDRLAQKRAVS